jgi:hypothetical protein
VKAGQTTLKPLIEGQKQYRVPIFQRPYVWDGAEVLQLWEDMTLQYRAIGPAGPGEPGNPSRSTHFLGSFVLAPIAGPSHSVTPYLIVDGQQRLTTLLLALAALRDTRAKADPREVGRFNLTYLRNEFAEGLDRYKPVPAQLDREPFFACIDGLAPDNGTGRILDAYHFFRLRLSRPLPGDEELLDLAAIERVILDRLAVVEITVEQDDNPHRIFESLNATGVGLTQLHPFSPRGGNAPWSLLCDNARVMARCPTCGEEVGGLGREVTFGHPDAIVALPEAERAERVTIAGKNFAQLDGKRFFIRVLLPVQLDIGHEYRFGVWIEVSLAEVAQQTP